MLLVLLNPPLVLLQRLTRSTLLDDGNEIKTEVCEKCHKYQPFCDDDVEVCENGVYLVRGNDATDPQRVHKDLLEGQHRPDKVLLRTEQFCAGRSWPGFESHRDPNMYGPILLLFYACASK